MQIHELNEFAGIPGAGDYLVTDNGTDTSKISASALLAETNEEIEALRAAVGSPLVASTAAAMTNTEKIYVYVGSQSGYTYGNWYYYNGTTWVSGGVYNSTAFVTDATLSVEGMAADAKAVGDELSDLRGELKDITCTDDGNGIIVITFE